MQEKTNTSTNLTPFLWGLVSALFLLGCALVWNDAAYVDESHHFGQITQFLQGDYTVQELLTVIPGYHVVVAFFIQFLGFSSLMAARAVSLLLSFAAAWGVYKTTGSETKTLQWALLPLAFPYSFLVYTDQLSALSIVAVWYFLNQNNKTASGLIGLAAVLIRQTNILWVGGLWAIHALMQAGSTTQLLTSIKQPAFWKEQAAAILPILPIFWLLIINGGLVLGDAASHSLGLFPENPLYLLMLLPFLFWPLLFEKKTQYNSTKTKWWLAVGIIAIACYVLFWDPVHPYNVGDYFLRNIALRLTQESTWAWSIGAILVGLGTYTLSRIQLQKKAYYWLYPLTLIALSLQELVETRYYIIPLLLVILWRKPATKEFEYGLIAWWIFLNFILLIGMFGTQTIFL